MDPESEIRNISKDVQQNGDFRGARAEMVFLLCGGGPGGPGTGGTPGSAQAEVAGFSSMLRCATLRFALFRFAFASLCFRFRFASNSKRETNCETIRF